MSIFNSYQKLCTQQLGKVVYVMFFCCISFVYYVARTVYVRVHKYICHRYMRMRVLGFAHWTMDTGWQQASSFITKNHSIPNYRNVTYAHRQNHRKVPESRQVS